MLSVFVNFLAKNVDFFEKILYCIIMESIGERIRKVRKHLGKSQSEFAGEFGLNHAIVSVWELNKIEIADKTILAICYRFGINEVWLRTGKGDMFGRTSSTGKSELLSIFDELSPAVQDILLDYARGLLKTQQTLAGKSAPPERGDASAAFPLEPRRPAGDPSCFEERRTVG
ncbi:MAG: helix-turn-helix domain-containing protein [Treponema sp.]|jgi:transcriptional regulator with XRE-family HTH domain|nr:helix-turn-helix domain-containing protein [Treponema sp.]